MPEATVPLFENAYLIVSNALLKNNQAMQLRLEEDYDYSLALDHLGEHEPYIKHFKLKIKFVNILRPSVARYSHHAFRGITSPQDKFRLIQVREAEIRESALSKPKELARSS